MKKKVEDYWNFRRVQGTGGIALCEVYYRDGKPWVCGSNKETFGVCGSEEELFMLYGRASAAFSKDLLVWPRDFTGEAPKAKARPKKTKKPK